MVEIAVGGQQGAFQKGNGGSNPQVVFTHVAGGEVGGEVGMFALAEGVYFGVAVVEGFDVDF